MPGVGVKGGVAAGDVRVEEEHAQRDNTAVSDKTTRLALFTIPPGSRKNRFRNMSR
jgi:hypothetical protein